MDYLPWLRDEAARAFKLEEESKATGNTGIASMLTDAAACYLEQAAAMEAAEAAPKPTRDAPLTAQQQQRQATE